MASGPRRGGTRWLDGGGTLPRRTGSELIESAEKEREIIDVSSPGEAPADALGELRLAVVELLENAIGHSRSDRPDIRVAVRPTGDRVTLVVGDDALPSRRSR